MGHGGDGGVFWQVACNSMAGRGLSTDVFSREEASVVPAHGKWLGSRPGDMINVLYTIHLFWLTTA